MQQLTPWIQSRFYYKNSTLPLSMGFLTFYYTGTTNKAPTFQEKNGVVNPNPVPLDIVGEAQIWLSENIVYDVEIKDANGALQDTRLGVSASSEGGGGGGLDSVTTANSETITLDGLGTQPNPLTATLNISSVTSNALGITTAGGGGVYVADMSEAIADKLDKVDATAQSVTSSVDFNGGARLDGGYFGTSSPQLIFGSGSSSYIFDNADVNFLLTKGFINGTIAEYQAGSTANGGYAQFLAKNEFLTSRNYNWVDSTNDLAYSFMEASNFTGSNSESQVQLTSGNATIPASQSFILSNLLGGGVDAFNFVGANAIFNGRILQGSVTDDGTTGVQCESIRTDGGGDFGGNTTAPYFGVNLNDGYEHFISSTGSNKQHLEVVSGGDLVLWSNRDDNPNRKSFIFNTSGDIITEGGAKFIGRILQGSVTDDGTTGVQATSGKFTDNLTVSKSNDVARINVEAPTGNVGSGASAGLNMLFGGTGLDWSILASNGGNNLRYYADGVNVSTLDKDGNLYLNIGTGTQVGLVGYDSNGKLIQGVGGGGGVTPSAWVNASLNSSLGIRSSMRPLRYRGDGIDGVQIEGSCKYNTGLALFPGFSIVLFTLPIGSRPNKDVNFTVQVGYNGSVPQIEAWASLNSSNGQVTLKNSDSVAISELYDITINTRFSLI